MKLKSMQLIGFKSFADKTTIDFQNGLTAIVGPNGSGKSNVIEAIRWVLGEQSAKHLRSTKMADVIFSGSKHHRALNRAEVILTFDNTDHYLNTNYTEITVTRKLFRNGDSNYYLNNQECRLKDINNLLMDTGVGLGSFSIISQGNVEAIFNSKPEERRNIIETTAGIYKYRQRKQVADHRLGETNDNLNRVNDIILELQSQVTTLETQSQAATEYQRLNAELQNWHQKQLAVNVQRLIAEYNASETTLQATSEQVAQLSQKIDKLRDQKRNSQNQIDQLAAEQETAQTKRFKTTSQIEQLNSQLKLDSQQSSFKNQQLQQAKDQLAKLVASYSQIEDQISTAAETVTNKSAAIAELKATLADSQRATINDQIAQVNTELNQLRNKYLTLLQRSSDFKNQLNYASKDNAQFSRQREMLTQRIQANQQTAADLKDQQAKLTQQLADKQSQLQETQAGATHNHEQEQALRQQLDQVQSKWYQQLQASQQLRAKLNGLTEYQNHHGGYLQGSRNLLEHRSEISGVIGPVADFITVDGPYVKAIETALGNRIQQIMVQDNASARTAVQFMTLHKLGRVTLLPLNSLTRRSLPAATVQQLKSVTGFVAVANQLVQMPTQYHQVRDYLLGNVIIANDLKAATQIGTLVNHRFRIVTLDGQIVNAGGSITGGANRKQFDGMLAQKEKLTTLTTSLKQVDQEVARLEQAVKTAQVELKQLAGQTSADDQAELTLKQELQMLQGQLKQTQTAIVTNQREAATQRLNLNTLTDNFTPRSDEKLSAELKAVNAEITQNQAAVKATNQRLDQLNQQQQQLVSAEQQQREKLVLEQAELAHVEQRVTDLNQQLTANQGQQIKCNQSIQALNDQITGKMTNVDLNAKIGVLQRLATDLDQQIDDRKQTLSQLKQSTAPLDEQIDQCQDALFRNQTDVERLERSQTTAKEQLQMQKTVASQKYGLSFQQLVDLVVTDDLELINHQMDRLKQRIQAIGPVNIDSINQFAEVNERYQFLKQQADDLIQSKQQLEATMNKMDATVKERFKATFEQLQAAFKTTFVEIFGGGDAKLKLTDPNHLLTTGIEIMAQPPGKRFRSMTLLSGGERSLTAIALLFAILKIQPVPFVILDEAESALDPANVDRFARYIQKLKEQTQFIVITHRKETMVYADNLYGVTMQDSGISKVLAVDLKKAQTTKG